MTEIKHSIKSVSKRTGLSPHVIRTWEKRYGTVKPVRSAGNQRLYAFADIERLSLLKRVTEEGHSIGTVAGLSTDRLASLVGGASETTLDVRPLETGRSGMGIRGQGVKMSGADRSEAEPGVGSVPDVTGFLRSALEAVGRMDAGSLENILDEASVSLGQMRLLAELIVPLVEEIGEQWSNGGFKVAHEHVATAVLRTFLGNIARPIALHPRAPTFLVTTTAGQIHELGAILAAAAASGHGWRIVYCGPSLPAEEIAAAAIRNHVLAVGLSIVHPSDDPALGTELLRLRRLLPDHVRILVGGRASAAYQAQIEAAGSVRVASLGELAARLDSLRSVPR